jgi:hypothetical protein
VVTEASDSDLDARTNAVGLFNTARSYWQSAVNLQALSLKLSHANAPVTFLICHAIELYLKAHLRGHGSTVADIKKIGHHVPELAQVAKSRGLVLEPQSVELLSYIDDTDTAIEARYIVTGFKMAPPNESLIDLAQQLDQRVGAALRSEGFPVREEAFPQPRSSVQNDEVNDAEEYIPYMTAKDREIVAYLLHHNQRLFTADSDGGHAKLLLTKGIVRIAAKAGQHIDLENVPFEIPKHIWDVLDRHKQQSPYETDDDAPYPWRVHWMER